MKKIYGLLVILWMMQLVIEAQGVKFHYASFDEVLLKAKQENKIVFIDCYTEWCGPCKMLSRDVFPQKEVGDFFNKHFVSYKVDMEKGEGILLKERFKVAAFPTLVWVDADGNEVHKSVGAPKADGLLKTAHLVVEGKGLLALERKYEASKNDTAVMNEYIAALSNAYEKERIQVVLTDYFKGAKGKVLLQEYNYGLINSYLRDVESKTFAWFDKHQGSFIELYGEKEVKQKLYRSYLDYGHGFVSTKNGEAVVDTEGFERYKKILSKRNVEGREKIIAFVEENVLRSTKQWEEFVAKVEDNISLGYHGEPNSFLYYNWAKAIEKGACTDNTILLKAASWMQDAFEASQWPLKHNIVYLENKLDILKLAAVEKAEIDALSDRISHLKTQVATDDNQQ